MVIEIVSYLNDRNNILRKENIEVKRDNLEINNIINDMFETLEESGGVGLAAPQIGKNLRVFIINLDGIKMTFINPKIIKKFGQKTLMEEGCLSVPDINVGIIRESEIFIEYYDRKWKYSNEHFDGILARIIQHEYDHLEGTLILDYVK